MDENVPPDGLADNVVILDQISPHNGRFENMLIQFVNKFISHYEREDVVDDQDFAGKLTRSRISTDKKAWIFPKLTVRTKDLIFNTLLRSNLTKTQ